VQREKLLYAVFIHRISLCSEFSTNNTIFKEQITVILSTLFDYYTQNDNGQPIFQMSLEI